MLGIEPKYYIHIYLWIVVLCSCFVFNRYSFYPQSRINNKKKNKGVIGVSLLTLLFIVFIGLRPVSQQFFVDMAGYSSKYGLGWGDPFTFDWSTDNKLFDNYLLFLASHRIPEVFFFLSIAVIYFGCMAWACSVVFPDDRLAAFLVCLGAFSTFSYATNGIKAGAAASIFLVAIAMTVNRKIIWAFILALVSLGFHHSMIVPVVALIVCYVIKNPKWYFILWAFTFLMALFHITFFQQLFAGLADEQGASYLTGNDGFIRIDILGGFRIDFIIYSVAPIIIGWYGIFIKRIASRAYSFVLNLYLFTNSVWLLCMYAEFTNRIAYLSWFMFPVVLVYPLLNEDWGHNQYQTFRWVALGHLGFTLFMGYVFY